MPRNHPDFPIAMFVARSMFVPLVPNDQYESMHQCFQFVQEMLWQPLDDQKPDKETIGNSDVSETQGAEGQVHFRLFEAPRFARNTPELKNFDQDALMQVLGAATFINAAPGHILCHQGEVGDRFFAIIEGMVSIHVRPKIEIESALATAAESKGSGNQLIKTMLAALSQHRVEVGAGPASPTPSSQTKYGHSQNKV